MFRGLLFILLLLLGNSLSLAQCVTIEFILADACGSPEGANEMVRFSVGSTQLASVDIEFDWPNNSFLDWCPEPAKTAALNATIISSCGFLLEPINDSIPANSKVIAISSTDFDVSANSFEGLDDTMYLLFQCAGNTSGHFSNSANSTRTLEIEVTGSCTGSDNAGYLGTSLIGGDGGGVEYVGNNATYVNYGCTAPVTTLNAGWAFTEVICDDYGAVNLTSLLTTATQGGTWTGNNVTGDSFNPQGLFGSTSITYTVTPGSGCAELKDSTITFLVDTSTGKMDTITACDFYEFNGSTLDSTAFISFEINGNTIYACDTIVNRLVIIEGATYSVEPSSVDIISGATVPFSVQNQDLNLSVSWSNQFNESCINDCAFELMPTEDGALYIFELQDSATGCISYDTLIAHVTYFSELNIPNTFSPNGDGSNDFFKVYAKDIGQIELLIYDRFGGLIFKSEDTNASWDGTFNGRELSQGVYLGVIEAIGRDGQKISKTLHINLIR